MIIETIRKKLKLIREAAKLSPEELARRMGKSFPPEHIIGIEEGTRNIGIATIEKYCRFCEAEFDLVIKPRGKVWELDFINITPSIHERWMRLAREEGSNIWLVTQTSPKRIFRMSNFWNSPTEQVKYTVILVRKGYSCP